MVENESSLALSSEVGEVEMTDGEKGARDATFAMVRAFALPSSTAGGEGGKAAAASSSWVGVLVGGMAMAAGATFAFTARAATFEDSLLTNAL